LKPASQRFYEIVSYKIFAAIKYRHAVAKLAYSEYCIFSAQRRYYEYDRVKKQMYKIHNPHLKSGYIRSVSYTPTVDEHGKSDWIMQYVPGEKAHIEYQFFTNKKQLKRVATKKPEETTTQTRAVELVGYFYQRFHHEEVITPNNKEIEQATELITKYGIDQSRFIVDYSLQEAQDTNYTPKFFGGILQYVNHAIESFNRRERQRQYDDARKLEERFQHAYESYKQREIARVKSTISPEEFAEIETAIRAELEAEGTFPNMIGMGVRIRTDALLEERACILPYEEWRNQQSHASKAHI
jgi:type I site-specific restriction-modification system R (restriction) subunit